MVIPGRRCQISGVKSLLCSVPIFAGIDDKALKIFLEHATRTVVPDGTVIGPDGAVNHCMYLIEAGSGGKAFPSWVERTAWMESISPARSRTAAHWVGPSTVV
jgi:hypothetical protein